MPISLLSTEGNVGPSDEALPVWHSCWCTHYWLGADTTHAEARARCGKVSDAREYIYIYIFWCILTSLPLFDSALSRGIAAENGIILFVDTRLEVNPFIHSFLLSFFFFTPSPLSPWSCHSWYLLFSILQFERALRKAALACDEYFISRRFLRGTFTNSWQASVFWLCCLLI